MAEKLLAQFQAGLEKGIAMASGMRISLPLCRRDTNDPRPFSDPYVVGLWELVHTVCTRAPPKIRGREEHVSRRDTSLFVRLGPRSTVGTTTRSPSLSQLSAIAIVAGSVLPSLEHVARQAPGEGGTWYKARAQQ